MVNPFDPTGSSCLDPSNGCAPYNLFGYGRSSQEALDFISTDVYRENESELTVASLVLSGNTGDFLLCPAMLVPWALLWVSNTWSEQVLMTLMSALLMARCDSTHGATTRPLMR